MAPDVDSGSSIRLVETTGTVDFAQNFTQPREIE
jgi:hypothetical protein